jgi:hypothetical protein
MLKFSNPTVNKAEKQFVNGAILCLLTGPLEGYKEKSIFRSFEM